MATSRTIAIIRGNSPTMVAVVPVRFAVAIALVIVGMVTLTPTITETIIPTRA